MEKRGEQFFENILSQVLDGEQQVKNVEFVSGGCINNTLRVDTGERAYFVKWNENFHPDMYEKEASGLDLLRKCPSLNIPKVYGHGIEGNSRFLVLELVQKQAPALDFWDSFGTSIAELHKITSDRYGLNQDNYIGRLHQKNTFHSSWTEFFISCRITPQLRMARDQGLINSRYAQKFEKLFSALPGIIPDEPPSLLHGDLWNGNFMIGNGGKPYLFDPAGYYGHREMEMAFTHMFGGFDREFYQSYQMHYPLQPGFHERIPLYNLYPLLVHVNLFGPSYLAGIDQTLAQHS